MPDDNQNVLAIETSGELLLLLTSLVGPSSFKTPESESSISSSMILPLRVPSTSECQFTVGVEVT